MTLGATAADLLKQAASQSGVADPVKEQTKQLLAQSGLPPEAIGFAQGLISNKGSLEDKLRGAAATAQGLLNQMSGPAGQITSQVSKTLTKALGIEESAVGDLGAAGGTAIGAAIAGPVGAAIGQFVGGTVVGGIVDVFTTSPSEKEKQRSGHDLQRINYFAQAQGLAPLGSTHGWTQNLDKWYALMQAGKIRIVQGKEGGATTPWAVKNGKLRQLSAAEVKAWPHVLDRNRLALDSVRMSGRLLHALVPVEARKILQAKKVAADLEKVKQVQAALKRAAEAVAQQKRADRRVEDLLKKQADAFTKQIDALAKQVGSSKTSKAPKSKTAPVAKSPPSKKPALTKEQQNYAKWLLS